MSMVDLLFWSGLAQASDCPLENAATGNSGDQPPVELVRTPHRFWHHLFLKTYTYHIELADGRTIPLGGDLSWCKDVFHSQHAGGTEGFINLIVPIGKVVPKHKHRRAGTITAMGNFRFFEPFGPGYYYVNQRGELVDERTPNEIARDERYPFD